MGNGATGRSEPLTPLAEDREEWWSADQRGSAPRDRRPPRSRPGSERRGRASTMAPPPEPPRSAPRARRRLRYDDASDGEASPDEERRRERRAPAASPAQPPARGRPPPPRSRTPSGGPRDSPAGGRHHRPPAPRGPPRGDRPRPPRDPRPARPPGRPAQPAQPAPPATPPTARSARGGRAEAAGADSPAGRAPRSESPRKRAAVGAERAAAAPPAEAADESDSDGSLGAEEVYDWCAFDTAQGLDLISDKAGATAPTPEKRERTPPPTPRPRATPAPARTPTPSRRRAAASPPPAAGGGGVVDTSRVSRRKASLPTEMAHPMPTSGDFLKKRYMVNNYILLDSVGTGSYADVRLAKEKTSDRLYAVKVINKQVLRRKLTGGSTMLDDVKREIAIMKKLSHPHVLRLFEVMDDPKVNKLYLVLEYMKLGDLMQIMRGDAKRYRCDAMGEGPLWTCIRQVASGLDYLHAQSIVHGDIKPQNLLLGEDGVLKIADFGISKMLAQEEALLETAGTPAFMCPEICAGRPYAGPSADVWALGVTMFMLRCGRPPFVADKVIRLYHRIIHDELRFPATEAPLARGLRELLLGMLAKDPAARSSLEAVRGAAWLRQPPPPARRPARDRPALAALEPRRDGVVEAAHRFEKITVSAADLDGAIVAKRKSRRAPTPEKAPEETAAPPARVLSSRDAEDKRRAFAKKHSKPSLRRRAASADDDDASDDDDLAGAVEDDGGALDLAVAVPPAAATHVLERRRFAAPAGLTNPLARVACAWHSRRGQRPSQEDRVTVIPDLAELPGCDDPRYSGYAYMGIFDGHGGDACATYLQRELHAGICRRGAQLFEDTRQAVARAFRETDERCCARLRAQDDGSGSTAVVCLFDGPGRRLVVAHAGDSRCVLGARGARGASLTQDHRLTRADELARVRGAGGLVVNHRLHGTLAVSRSFGDVAHKSGEPPVLTATPEVRIQNVTEEDEFVVLGCDGLWDALSARVVANFIRGELNDHGDLQRAARAVTEEALRRGSVDNVSVILVALNHGDGDDDRPGSAAGAAEEVD
ncbi:unnamed protein product [Pelagomonas calceolata]|uniref:Uncharacterized protein n=1 Tax=Pelagomonas calceolata TaxID=35677 RepID=A0A8J2SGG2_9STRA|nr:unnamed protein product [Pelagomonas calceolata]